FVAMGGTTYAVKRLPKRSVGSAQLKKDAVRTRNIKARNVTRSKIAKRSVNSDLVGTDALLGKNILESSLDTVPKAKDAEHATTADKLNGLGVQKFAFRAAVGSSTPSLLSLGGLTLNAACNAGPTPSISATTTVSNAIVHSGGTYGLSSSFYTADNTFNVGD